MERVVVYGVQHSPAALGRYHVPPTIVNFIQQAQKAGNGYVDSRGAAVIWVEAGKS